MSVGRLRGNQSPNLPKVVFPLTSPKFGKGYCIKKSGGSGYIDQHYSPLFKKIFLYWSIILPKMGIKCASEMQDQIRPYNLDPSVPGKGVKTFTLKNGVTISVINLIGRVFLPMTQSNPFYALDEILKTLNSDIIFVDFHAEATAEKRCLAEYAKGRVTAVIGTHTHVQTNDAKILANGTFFLTDAGMNGAYDSSLGVELDGAIYRTVTGIPSLNAIPRKGRKLVNAVSLVIDIEQKKVIEYSLINEVMC